MPLPGDEMLIINEEGKLQGLPYNEEATRHIASASSAFVAEDTLRDWVRELIDEWFDQCGESPFKVLIMGLLHNALGQVDWAHLTRAFDEPSAIERRTYGNRF